MISATRQSLLESRGLKENLTAPAKKSISVLADANLILRQGEMVAIGSALGAGKSTLLHLLAALDTPTSGTVYFATKAIESINDAALAEFRNRAIDFCGNATSCLRTLRCGKRSHAVVGARRKILLTARRMARKWIAEVGLENRADPPRWGTLRRGTAARCDCPGARH